MYGRKIYEFAITNVPNAMKTCMELSKQPIQDLKRSSFTRRMKKWMKLSSIVLQTLRNDSPDGVMPMTIDKLGNSSVATVPTLFDLVTKGNLEGHEVSKGDLVMFANVGAGMNINAIVYRI